MRTRFARLRAKRLAPAAVLAAGSLGLTACGPGTAADVGQIRQVITGFSEASGPSACKYLTTGALSELYVGNGHAAHSRSEAMAACVARSGSFKGAPVKIGRVWFPQNSRTASAYARSPDGTSRWQLFLHKVGNGWQIAHIQH